MEDSRGRRRSARGSGGGGVVVASGSVWESRMKLDEVRGGIKVFNGGEKEIGAGSARRSSIGARTWRSEIDLERNKTVAKVRSDSLRRSSSDSEKSPIQSPATRTARSGRRSELGLSRSVDDGGIETLSRGRRKLIRSGSVSGAVESVHEAQSTKELEPEPEIEPVPEPDNEVVEELEKSCDSSGAEIENSDNNPIVKMEEDLGLCQEKAISSKNTIQIDDCDIVENGDEGEMEEEDEEYEETEEKSNPVVEMEENLGLCQEKAISSNNLIQIDDCDIVEEDDEGEIEEEDDDYEEIEEEKEIDIKEMDVLEIEHKPKKKVVLVEEEKIEEVVIEEKKILHNLNTKPAIMASTLVRRHHPPPSPVIRRSTIHQNRHQQQKQKQPTKPIPPCDQSRRFPETQSKLQSLVDLVMWRDVSRSAFVFGIGTFVIISSSYTQDLNISFISVISYMGLVYLASIFLYKSIICRGVIGTDGDGDESCLVGEGEAVWLIKLFLPYLNEFLLKLRALFSGDPPTTMKLAVLLFVLARCGSSITIWKMAKFGFFGVFTVPKVCSSYSSQITAYGKFWIRRFEDAWESCTHKKAVAVGIFTLVWNLSSIVARVWTVFMVCVALKYYQMSVMVRDDWVEEEEHDGDAGADIGETSRKLHGPTIVDSNKNKKGF